MDVHKIFAEKGTKHLSKLKDFKNGELPHGILAKGRTGYGATTVALESPHPYIVIVKSVRNLNVVFLL